MVTTESRCGKLGSRWMVTMKNTIKTCLVIMAMGFSIWGMPVKAYWTGRSYPVSTVTGRYAVNCEYSYGSQKFWKTFPTRCENSIEVY